MLSDAEISKLKQELHLGREIAALIENQTVKNAVTGLLNGIQNEWLTTTSVEARELLWQKALGVQEFVAALKSIVDTGKMAAHQLDSYAQQRGEHD